MIVFHYRLHAGTGYLRGILPDDSLLDEPLQPTEIGVDVDSEHRLTGSLDFDLYAEKRRQIARRLRKARDAPAHVSPAIDWLGTLASHLTAPSSLR